MPGRDEETTADVTEHRLEAALAFALVGANLERADLRGLNLSGANLTNANLRGADLTGANLSGAILLKADLSRANVQRCDFSGADLSAADLTMCYARVANFCGARMWNTYMRYGIFKNAYFVGADMRGADFVNSMFLGAKFDDANIWGIQNAERAIFTWWISPYGSGKISYSPIPGWIRMDRSNTGSISVQENASRERTESVVESGYRPNE